MAELQSKDVWGHPRPLSTLFFSEMWERFSFYGIQPILALFMVATIMQGGLDLPAKTAGAVVGIFSGSVYLAAIPGGWLADNWLGQKWAVWYGSILIALGHLSIALSYFYGHKIFFLGLFLIVLGSGLFKTSISVMVGMLYKKEDNRRDSGFSLFYMGINLGGFIAPLLTGLASNVAYWHLSFGIGGLGMLIALVIFRFIAMPSMTKYAKTHQIDMRWEEPVRKMPHIEWIMGCVAVIVIGLIAALMSGVIMINPIFVADSMVKIVSFVCIGYFAYLFFTSHLNRAEQLNCLLCLVLLIASAVFWSAFEQQPTSYNLFTNLYVNRNFFGYEVPTAWIQAINPLAIIIFAPIFGWLWMRLERVNKQPDYLVKFALGLFLGALGFCFMIFAALHVIHLDGAKISIIWLVVSLLFLTFGELSLSPVGLAAMTKLSPERIRGQMMGLWHGFSAIGSVIAGLIGGNVSADNLANLPKVFMSSTLSLLCGGVVVLLIYGLIFIYRRRQLSIA